MMIDKNRFEQIYNIITSNEVKALKNEKEKFKFLNIYEQTVDETNLQIIDLGFENLSKMIVEVVNYNYKSRFVDDIRDTVKLILELQNANSKKALKIKDIFEKESGDIMKLDFDIVVPLKEYLNLIIVNIEGLNNNQYVVIVDGLKEIINCDEFKVTIFFKSYNICMKNKSILKLTGLLDRIVTDSIHCSLPLSINYDTVNNIINSEREKSMNKIKSIIL